MKKCADCKFCVMIDYGYSNYTVEGTSVYCGKNLHPNPGFDNWYTEEKEHLYAEHCSEFTEGERIRIDVEKESLDYLSEKEKALYDVAKKLI